MQRNGEYRLWESDGPVLHLAGRLTDEVVGFIGPTTNALADAGVRQVLIAQEPTDKQLLSRIHPSVEQVLLDRELPATRRWILTWSSFRRVLARVGRPRAVHVHGFAPSLIAPYALRQLRREIPVVYSPHSSKAIGPLRFVGHPLWWITRPLLPSQAQRARAIATVAADARAWGGLSSQTVDVVESPIDSAFFYLDMTEAEKPKVVAGGLPIPTQAADLLAQLQVLLNDEEPCISLHWIGLTPGPAAGDRLRAAGISAVPASDAGRRCELLQDAWIYLAPAKTTGFPAHLAEAMAAGLPCMVVDTPYHRSLIRDGETGLLYRTIVEAVAHLTMLIESVELRHRLGRCARKEAVMRFTERQFRDSLIAAYERTVFDAETKGTVAKKSLA